MDGLISIMALVIIYFAILIHDHIVNPDQPKNTDQDGLYF